MPENCDDKNDVRKVEPGCFGHLIQMYCDAQYLLGYMIRPNSEKYRETYCIFNILMIVEVSFCIFPVCIFMENHDEKNHV